jgi:hypothetical protein
MEERVIPFEVKEILPAAALISVIKKGNEALEKETAKSAKLQKDLEKIITETAMAAFRLNLYENEFSAEAKTALTHLRGVLSGNGITYNDYLGATVDDELASNVRIVGWEDGELPYETVYECYTPEVRLNGRLLHTAELFCKRSINEIEGDQK